MLDALTDRLRWDAVRATVPGSLPVLFFGDLSRAAVATIGINPSRQEYHSRMGVELSGPDRRFESLSSLGVADRRSLSPSLGAQAMRTMTAYFAPGKPVYHWVQPLVRVMSRFGASFTNGDVAHLDLVQEATDPVWTGLRSVDRGSASALLQRDLPFLHWEIEMFPLRTLVCTSATVQRHVLPMVNARVIKQGKMARLTWSVAIGWVAGRAVGVVGWNIPLKRPAGLDNDGQHALGAILKRELATVLP